MSLWKCAGNDSMEGIYAKTKVTVTFLPAEVQMKFCDHAK